MISSTTTTAAAITPGDACFDAAILIPYTFLRSLAPRRPE
jgi:hypothetical protein